ncbi:hypothetical protein [Oceanobacter sp. 3_MG-2023]|uniref:hypothetical protein n=1 Tax=Oceanobacter sp. 3_MG-2023 TaxID=3062622 RepID=UPI002732A744|nr:hypothetical protein [Oceanobacter sp. 3_MG-2023]MDP2505378.1 hypothetical protein [Oceanobacter sp. 3_MG-2023]
MVEAIDSEDDSMPLVANSALINSGSLLLVDMMHSMNELDGVPVDGDSITNIAAPQLMELTSSNSSDAQAIFNTNAESTDMVLTRTEDGGLAAVVSQITDSLGRYSIITFPLALREYILENPNHSYYLGVIENISNVAIYESGTQPIEAGIYNNSGATSSHLVMLQHGLARPYGTQDTVLGQRRWPSESTTGPKYVSVGASAFRGSVPEEIDDLIAAFVWGGYRSMGGPSLNSARSSILYQIYCEDLTVSGNSYSDVDTAQYSYFTSIFDVGST